MNIRLTRRQIIKGISLSSLGLAAPAWLSGCATDPITGRPSLMLLSREDEIAIDQQQAPHQISADYGVAPQPELNDYVAEVGQAIAAASHRPDMPYNFQVVNANYINAYAFPGGTIALTRGIILEMSNEAEMAALLGHEVVHVAGRHTGSSMSRGMLTQAAVGTVASGLGESPLAGVVGTVGQIGAGALLANYSRDNEREADGIGLEYAVAAGHNPEGMVGLATMLNTLSSRKPSAIEVMFSSHPDSGERLETARRLVNNYGPDVRNRNLHRERFMEMTAGIRALQSAIEAMQEGERLLAQGEVEAAEQSLGRAVELAPDDYTGLMLMGKLQLTQEDEARAMEYFDRASAVLPNEGQAVQYKGLAYLGQERFDRAIDQFLAYEELLPGNPGMDFLLGYSYDQQAQREPAADRYQRYLQQVQQGPQAEYAYQRLSEWGMI